MALPIKETPTLSGHDAVEFKRQIALSTPITPQRLAEMQRNYETIRKLAK